MVNVIPCIEADQGNQEEVVISVRGRVDIRLHGTVISEEVDIGDRRVVDDNNGANYGDGSDVWNLGAMDSLESYSRVQNEGERTESVRMNAGAEYITEERGDQVDTEDVMKERDRVDAEGETKERDRVDAEGETKERDRVDAEGETKERDRVDAEDETKERDRVDAEGETKERDRVDAEGETKERDRVDAEGETKERDRVDAEGETKERDRVDAEGETKERDRVDAEGETKERDRVDAEGETKERDQVDGEVIKERVSGCTNGVSAKVLAEQDSKMYPKPSNKNENNCRCNQPQHYQSMDETGNRRLLSSVTPHTPTRLTLFYKPSKISPPVVKYFPKEVIVRAKGEHVSFGRSLDSDVQLNDNCMSRNYVLLWLPINNCGTFKLRNISSSKEVTVNDVLLCPNCNSEIIFTNNSKIVLDNIELTAVVREGSPSSTNYEVKIEPTISRSTSLQQEPTWISSSPNVGATAHQTDHIVSSTYRRSLYAHSRYHSAGPVEHSLTNAISRNLLPEEN